MYTMMIQNKTIWKSGGEDGTFLDLIKYETADSVKKFIQHSI